MASSTRLLYRAPDGKILEQSVPYSSIEYVRKENDVGVLTARIVPKFPVGYFRRDGIFEIWRSIGGRETLETEAAWLVRKVRYATNQAGEDELEITAYDGNVILSDRIIAYDNGTSYTDKLGLADDLMKDIVLENYGIAAFDPDRDLSALVSVQAKSAQGLIVGDRIGRKRVMDVLQDFAAASEGGGVRIIFDMVRLLDGRFEFRTYKNYRGMDHSADSDNPVRAAQELGNLSQPEIVLDYSEEVNYAYVGGKGDEEWRLIAQSGDTTRIGLSPFARREGWFEYSNEDDPTRLGKMAQAELQRGRPRILFNGLLLDTPAATYGLHYKWGDLVTALYKGYRFDSRIDALRVMVDRDGGEQIEARLKGESNA